MRGFLPKLDTLRGHGALRHLRRVLEEMRARHTAEEAASEAPNGAFAGTDVDAHAVQLEQQDEKLEELERLEEARSEELRALVESAAGALELEQLHIAQARIVCLTAPWFAAANSHTNLQGLPGAYNFGRIPVADAIGDGEAYGDRMPVDALAGGKGLVHNGARPQPF